MCRIIILLIVGFFIQLPLSYSQDLTDTYLKIDCEISLSHKSKDTIFAYKSESCNLSRVKVEENGTWIIYSKEDSSLVIETFQIVDSQIEGLRYLKNDEGESYYINYVNGEYHGPFIHLSSTNKPMLFVNYSNGNPSGDYYYYSYDKLDDELISISQYNKKGKLKNDKYS